MALADKILNKPTDATQSKETPGTTTLKPSLDLIYFVNMTKFTSLSLTSYHFLSLAEQDVGSSDDKVETEEAICKCNFHE